MSELLTVFFFKLKQEGKSIWDWIVAVQFLIAASFISYLIFDQLNAKSWLALFWVVAIFSLIQASSRGLKAEMGEQYYFYFQLCSAETILLSGIMMAFIQNLVLLFLLWGVMSFLFGNFIFHYPAFIASIILAALNFATIVHLVNGLAHRSNKSQTLFPAMSIPLIIPVILELYNLGAIAAGLNPVANNWFADAFILLGMGLMFGVASVFLFPFVWKD